MGNQSGGSPFRPSREAFRVGRRQEASELEDDRYIRVLLMGKPKVGKSMLAVGTSPPPVHVLLCESDSALRPAARAFGGRSFTFDRVKGWNSMSQSVQDAKKDVEAGKIGTLIIDPFSNFAARLEQECLAATDTGRGPDGRRAYPEYNRRIDHILDQLFRLPCHLVVITHYIDTGGGEVQPEGGGDPTPRIGQDIVPLLAGKARALVAAKFPDVIWMDYTQKGERVLVTGPRGVWGPGCRSLDDTTIIPADVRKGGRNCGIRALIKAFEDANKPLNGASTQKDRREKPVQRQVLHRR